MRFLGFYGTWSQAPVFDSILNSGDAAMYATRFVIGETGTPFGINPFDAKARAKIEKSDYSAVDMGRIVVSNQSIGAGAGRPASPNLLAPSTGLLRGLTQLTYDYVDAQGKTVKSYTFDYVPKSSYTSVKDRASTAEEEMGEIPFFNGTAADGTRVADGTLTLVQTATTAGPNPVERKQELPFSYDTTAPAVSDYRVSGAGESATVQFTVTDATYVAGVDFHDPKTGNYFYRVLATDDMMTSSVEGARTYAFSVSVADLKQAWKAAGLSEGAFPTAVPLYAWDYGLNRSDPVNFTPSGAADKDGFVIDTATGELTAYAGTSMFVTIPNTVRSIAAGAFKGSAVQTVIIPASVERIGEAAFEETESLTSVTFQTSADEPSKLKSVGALAFAQSGEFSLVLPEGVTALGEGVFAESALVSASIPASVKDIPAKAFAGSHVKDVLLAEGIRSIGEAAFADCSKLSSVKHGESAGLPNSIESIGKRTFANAAIGDLELGTGVTSIGAEAFTGSSLAGLTVPDSVTKLGEGALSGMKKLRSITVGAGVPEASFTGAFAGDAALKAIKTTSEVAANVVSVDGVLFSADKTRLIAFPQGSIGIYRVPDGTVAVAESAFAGAAVRSVTFPESLRSVGKDAFAESFLAGNVVLTRSEERRVGKECRSRWSPYH